MLTCRGNTDSAEASNSNESVSDADSQVCILLQDLQADLHSIMRLEKRSAEYQLAVYMGAGSQYVKHRDALPDDGADPNQRRVGELHVVLHHAIACAPSVVKTTASAFEQVYQQPNNLHQHPNKPYHRE